MGNEKNNHTSLGRRLIQRAGESLLRVGQRSDNDLAAAANATAFNAAFNEAQRANMPDINFASAMEITAVYACVRLIADTLSTIPLHIKERNDDGGRKTVYDHPLASLWYEPSPKMSRIQLMKTLIASVLLRGNGYAYISERDKQGYATRLDFKSTSDVQIVKTDDAVFYRVTKVPGLVSARDMIHLKAFSHDGITGLSPITMHRESLGLAAAATIFGSQFFANGCHTSGVFKYPAKLNDSDWQRLNTELVERYVGLRNSAAPLLLEGGLDYQSVSMSNEDAQYLQTRKFQSNEIARIFRVPPHLIGDLEKSSYNNNEQQYTEFISVCLRPLAVEIEEELNHKLLTYAEAPKYFHCLELDGLARGDMQARAEFYAKCIQNGVMKPNEARALENLPAVDGGDTLFLASNIQNITMANKITIP